MATVFTEAFAMSTSFSDYKTYRGYSMTGSGGPTGPAQSGGPGSPWSGNWYLEWGNSAWGALRNSCLPTARNRFIMGLRFAWVSGGFRLIARDSAGNDAVVVSNNNGSSTWTVSDGVNSTTIGNFTFSPTSNSWYYLEVDFNTAGNIIVRVTSGGTPTTLFTSAYDVTRSLVGFGLDNTGSGGDFYFTDVYVLDPSTGTNTSFLGDVHVEGQHVSGAGASTQWTPSPNTNANWQNVQDSTGPDGDTTYNHANSSGYRDYYAQPNINEASPTAVYAMGVWTIAKTAAAGNGGYKPSLSSSGTQLDGSLASPSTSVYESASLYADTDPHTGSAWTASGVNAAEPGVVLV